MSVNADLIALAPQTGAAPLGAGAAPTAATPPAATTVAAVVVPAGGRGVAARVASVLTTIVLGLTVVAFLFLGVGPRVFGYQTATMLTGSMSPGINPGDVVVTVPAPVAEVRVGDVISYHIPVEDHRVETHRVVKVSRDAAGRTAVVTKGDANDGIDPWTATLEGDTVYQAKAVIPYVGSAIRALRTPLVQHGLLWGALGGVLLLGLWQLWGGSSTPTAVGDESHGRGDAAADGTVGGAPDGR